MTVSASGGGVLVSAVGAKVRLFTERGETGPEFDALVREVKLLHPDPRRAHLEVRDFYIHVAHGRVHECLRATDETLAECSLRLREAIGDLKAIAKNRLFEAHLRAVEGYEAWFSKDAARADRHFTRAEALGREEGAPWVLYAVCRGRAFMLREQGKHDCALDQARMAEALARDTASAYRVRWIREEFALRAALRRDAALEPAIPGVARALVPPAPELRVPARFVRRSLRALLRIGQATAQELEPEYQARVILDELIYTLGADQGVIFWISADRLVPEDAESDRALTVLSARDAQGRDLAEPEHDADIVSDVVSSGTAQVVNPDASRSNSAVRRADARSILAAPLTERSSVVGVAYLVRDASRVEFNDVDSQLLGQLGAQVPLTLELARVLRTRERAEADARVAQRMDAIGRLAGGIAHDFNNMLAAILVAADAIADQRAPDEVVHDANTIRSAAQRARDLTRQLLAFSRGQYLNPQIIQLSQVIQRSVPALQRLIGPSIRLELDLDPDLDAVRADPAQIEQVLRNLVANAADAMPEGGTLRIETARASSSSSDRDGPSAAAPCVVMAVSDTGHGMDEHTQAKIFDPFFTTKTHGSAAGLGLSTSYGIVLQSGGRIEVDSKPGLGSTFRIYLPASRQPVTAPPPQSFIRDIRTKTVLLVDDEPLVRESLRRMLKQLGCGVICAAHAREALSALEAGDNAVDLVITDVIMPDMNGLELAREIGRLRAELPVLFISGYTNGVLAERGILRDHVEFLQKPISLDALADRINRILGDAPAADAQASTESNSA
jgi:signal transduction histidine kinase/ActR/RegA family two-component response regulator